MDSESPLPPLLLEDSTRCCNCACCCLSSRSRSVKRKLDEVATDRGIPAIGTRDVSVARVEIENECAALREALTSQQHSIQELYTELEEERNASTSAANEAMSMILRLQREKAEVQMEARQFKRFAEEKMAHDQQELLALEDVLYKREQLIQSLTCEIQAYKHRLMSFGYSEAEAEAEGLCPGNRGGGFQADETDEFQFEFPPFDYPPLKCNQNEQFIPPSGPGDDAPFDLDKYPFGETPKEHLQNLEFRIQQLERSPRNNQMNGGDYPSTRSFVEKVAIGQCPKQPDHARRLSTDSCSSFSGVIKETCCIGSLRKTGDFLNAEGDLRKATDNTSEVGDDMSDRIYTVDSVQTKATVGVCDDCATTPQEPVSRTDAGEMDVKKLYTRLQALEADRESMRQAIISMRTEKAQLVLLKEIAQQLCKEMPPHNRVSMKKPSPTGSFSLMSALKWVMSFVLWRRRAQQSKYVFGSSGNNLGLLLLLDKSPRMRQWRCLTRVSAT